MDSLPPEVEQHFQQLVGKKLVELATQIRDESQREMGTAYPPASQEGEFPHQRLGTLQGGIVLEPTTPEEAGRQGLVKVGYSKSAFYGGILELFRRRLGIAAVVKRITGK